MWNTSDGKRTLEGAEADLVRYAIDVMIDELQLSFDDDWEEDTSWDCHCGVSVFDSLSAHQRVGLLHDAARYLLTNTDASPPPTATSDATIAAIFLEIRDQIHIEIDFGPGERTEPESTAGNRWNQFGDDDFAEAPTHWRGLVLAAYEAISQSDLLPPGSPLINCADLETWELIVESLTDRILQDRDFELSSVFLDAAPDVSDARKRLLGISKDYFTSLAPDPRPTEIAGLISKTRHIVRAKPR